MTATPNHPGTAPRDADEESDNWLAWLDNPSPADLEWIAQRDARDHRVGALLRELYYFDSADPPSRWNPERQTEEAYWIGCSQISPGYTAEDLELALARRCDSSIPKPNVEALRSPDSQLRHDVLILYEVGIQRSWELARADVMPTREHCESEVRAFLSRRIAEARDWRPAANAFDIALSALVKRTLERRRADRPASR